MQFELLLLAASALAAPVPAPGNIPSASTAQSQLNALTVRAVGSQDGYSRDLFNHWITISGSCNTRETVLKRDGTNVVTDSACASVSGSWYSPYDGATWSAASDVDIDHIVPVSFPAPSSKTNTPSSVTPGSRVPIPGIRASVSSLPTI
jgi:hypothetical protein